MSSGHSIERVQVFDMTSEKNSADVESKDENAKNSAQVRIVSKTELVDVVTEIGGSVEQTPKKSDRGSSE